MYLGRALPMVSKKKTVGRERVDSSTLSLPQERASHHLRNSMIVPCFGTNKTLTFSYLVVVCMPQRSPGVLFKMPPNLTMPHDGGRTGAWWGLVGERLLPPESQKNNKKINTFM